MNWLVAIGSGIVGFCLMQVYGGAKFKGGSNGFFSFIFGFGIFLIALGVTQ